MKTPTRLALLLAALLCSVATYAQENARSSLEVTADEDGDVAVVMDTESIRMTILPAYQASISAFIFKPSGNDILMRQTIKFLQAGSGLLQDNFWEQDWRFSEFRHKWYDFQIISQGPEELAVKFWTTSDGWLQADDSGVKSDLISNIKIERTIRMPVGKPYFMADVVLSIDMTKDTAGHAKLPQFWVHNGSLFTDDLSDEMQRPHTLGIAEQTPTGRTVTGDFVYAPMIAEGWSAHTSPKTKEGIVYLMDPSYVQSLYNCGTATLEWFGDNMLITRSRPLRTRIYILPVIGLDKVHFADPHMILKLAPRVIEEGDEAGNVELKFSVSPSFKQVRSITFESVVVHGLHERNEKRVAMAEPLPSVRNLRVESPAHATGIFRRPDGLPFTHQMPLKFEITAKVEMLDERDRLVTRDVKFEYFHLGAYPTGKNQHLQGRDPLAVLSKVDTRPWIPTPDQDLTPDPETFRVFSLIGLHGGQYGLYDALAMSKSKDGTPLAWDRETDAGFSIGYTKQHGGLSNFPYDFERLFQYRVMVNCNTQSDITRLVGQSILAGYLGRGGGYVTFGGESAYRVQPPDGHALSAFEVVTPRSNSINMPWEPQPARLVVTKPDHPIFTGNGTTAPAVDLSKLPHSLSWHELTLKKIRGKPFLSDPFEPIMVDIRSLPGDLQAAIQAMPAEQRPDRAILAAQLRNQLTDDTRALLDAAIPRVFKDVPQAAFKDGVFDRAQLAKITDAHKIDMREAFVDEGDTTKETVNSWLDVNFARPGKVSLATLPPELQTQIADIIQQAITSGGTFLVDGDYLQVPDTHRPELASALLLKADELPQTAQVTVLMEVETTDGKRWPFMVELTHGQQDPADPTRIVPNPDSGRVVTFLNSPFGDPSAFAKDVVPYWQWGPWKQLVANAIMYAGHEL